jgi:hypothetical protein
MKEIYQLNNKGKKVAIVESKVAEQQLRKM